MNADTMSIVDELSVEDLRLFMDPERRAFSRLVQSPRFDEQAAVEVVAVWHWLDMHAGFPDAVSRILSLPTPSLYELAEEALSFVYFVETGEPDGLDRFTAMLYFIGTDGFSLGRDQANRDGTIRTIKWFMEKVRPRLFDGDVDEEGFPQWDEELGLKYCGDFFD